MSKQVDAKTKAKRQQHRKDHYTEADRSFKGKGQKARRAGRQENFNAQGNESAADFNFDQHGKGHVSGQEISHLRKQGQSRADIMSAARASGAELGGRTQRKFARWDAKAAAKEKAKAVKAQPEPVASTPTPTSSPAKNSGNTNIEQESSMDRDFGDNQNTIGDNNTIGGDLNQGNQDLSTNINEQSAGDEQMAYTGGSKDFYKNNPGTPYKPEEAAQSFLEDKKQPIKDSFNTNIDQEQSFDRDFGDNQNTIGNDNNIFGNVNQGNQDFSINIGNQQAGAGGTAGGGTMSNAAEGAAAKAGFENTWERSNAKFNPMAFAASNVAAADKLGGTSNLIKGLDNTTDANIDYYRKASDRGTLGLYGDIWNMKAPTWKAPGDLDKIETTYDKDKDDEE